MKLYLLRPIEDDDDSPWTTWFDKCFGFVIRAATEQDARAIADANAGDENDEAQFPRPWLNPTLSTCVELTAAGEAEVVIQDFHVA